tara:strand:- start:112 stop:1089 length:978 start_codon:yes stop_codon:yes gene_type:complete
MKKIFIKICKFLGYEILDQNKFFSPTLEKELNNELSVLNQKSIILPLGHVNITRKVKSILIILRMNTVVEMWDQNRKRLFEFPKIEYSKRSLNSLIKSINFFKKKYPIVKVNTIIIDDNSKTENLNQIKNLIDNYDIEIINVDYSKYQNLISKQKNKETFANLASSLQSFELGKERGEDLIYFLEDDYLHFESMLDEMVASFERVSSQINKDIFMCPADYPYLYMDNTKTNVLIGSKRHWRTVNGTLFSFMTTKNLIEKYWDNFHKTCLDRHDPFEKYINEIYTKEICISPLKSLSLHFTNINSSYGLSPFIDYKKLWEENQLND